MVKRSTVAVLVGIGALIPIGVWMARPIIAGLISPLDRALSCKSVGTPHRKAEPGYMWEGLVIVACNQDINTEIYAYIKGEGARVIWLLRAYLPRATIDGWVGEYNLELVPGKDMNAQLRLFRAKVAQFKGAGFPAGLLDKQLAWMNDIAPKVAEHIGVSAWV